MAKVQKAKSTMWMNFLPMGEALAGWMPMISGERIMASQLLNDFELRRIFYTVTT